jgi:hypothetical protein
MAAHKSLYGAGMESAAWLIQAAAMHCPEWLAISGFPVKVFLKSAFGLLPVRPMAIIIRIA